MPLEMQIVGLPVYFLGGGNLLVMLWIAYLIDPITFYLFKNNIVDGETPNLTPAQEKKYTEDKRFLIPLYLFPIVDTLTHIWILIIFSDIVKIDHWFFENKLMDSYLKLGAFLFYWGYSMGIAGLAAHELIHRKESIHKATGMLIFSRFFWAWFSMEHVSGHHKNIATPLDPATARKGDNVYSHVIRSATGGFMNTWVRELARVQKRNLKKGESDTLKIIFANIMHNKVVHILSMQALSIVLIYYFLGARSLMIQFIYAGVGIFFNEWSNFVEHYGLQRKL